MDERTEERMAPCSLSPSFHRSIHLVQVSLSDCHQPGRAEEKAIALNTPQVAMEDRVKTKTKKRRSLDIFVFYQTIYKGTFRIIIYLGSTRVEDADDDARLDLAVEKWRFHQDEIDEMCY